MYPGQQYRGRGRGVAQNPNVYVVNPNAQQQIQQNQQQIQQNQQRMQYGQQPVQQQVVYAQPPQQYGQQPVQYAQQPQYAPQQPQVVYQQPQQPVQYGQPPPQQVIYGQPPPQQQPVQYVQQPQYGQQPVQYAQPTAPTQPQPQPVAPYGQQPTLYGQPQPNPVQYAQPAPSSVYPQVKKNAGPPPPSYNAQHKKKNIYQIADMKINDNTNNTSSSSGSNATWEQPRADAKGTCPAHPNYSMTQATEDAKVLRKAMKGVGCEKNKVVAITGSRNGVQRALIKKAFVTIDSILYNNNKKRDILRDLKSELGGSLKKLVCACYMEVGEFDARLVLNALAGMGFNSELLIEVICTRTNKQIIDMKKAWNTALRRTKSMDEEVRGETKKMMSGNHFQSLMLTLLQAKRPPNSKPNITEVKRVAEELNRHVKQSKKSDCKTKFVDVYTTRSWAFIGAMSVEFQNISKKYTLETAIKKTFGDGSDTSKALRVITAFCSQPYDFWAERLRKSMKGLGTVDDLLIRIIVSRCEVDMFNIRNVFGQRYGNGKTLKNWIEDDTSGAYRRILSLLCGYGN